MEQRVHALDDRYGLGRAYDEISYYIVPETYAFLRHSAHRSTRWRVGETARGFLDLEPAGAPRLVR